jgi:hypothetical protein
MIKIINLILLINHVVIINTINKEYIHQNI